MTTILELKDVNAYYGKAHILHGVNLSIMRGEVTALLGRNGMGKSTTLKAIMGMVPVPRGQIILEGSDVNGKTIDAIARLGIGYVPEDRRIFASMSAKENLLVSYIRGKSSIKESLEKVYSLFPVLYEKSALRADLLSGGEQQMLAIGRCLMNDPIVMLLDEPCEGLAPLIVKELRKCVNKLLQEKISVLLVEQSIRLAKDVASKSYVLNKGQICHEGSIGEILSDSYIMKQYLGVGSENNHSV